MGKPAPELIDLMSALRLRRGAPAPRPPAAWRLDVLRGTLAELSGAGPACCLTLAFSMVLEAQHAGEPVAWVTSTDSVFYPPDAAASGVDLDNLAVVRLAEPRMLPRAADHLTRSGAFGLVVVDGIAGRHRSRWRFEVPIPLQSRLVGCAQKHDAAVVFLTEKTDEAPSLGSLVALRGETIRSDAGDDRFTCRLRILKDKRRGPGWTHAEVCRGPDGLR